MRKALVVLATVALLAACSAAARAADDIHLDPAETSKGFAKDAIAQVDDAAQKLGELAEAMPEGRYDWRPGKGVRSVSEVFRHVAAANYLLTQILGIQTPDGLDPATFEKTPMPKKQIAELLAKSFVHVRRVIASVTDDQLDDELMFFGEQSTKREVILTVISHAHEHLGQSIAYARMNKVVPPWTARAEAEAAAAAAAARNRKPH